MNVLECKNLTKSYKRGQPVLKDMNLALPAGRIVGLLGPNGCGKSTLIKLIAGLLQPDSGTITVDGHPISPESKGLVSYLPERPYFNPHQRVNDLIAMFRDFYTDFDEEIARKLLTDLNIDPKARMRTLSKGTKEKVQLILVMSRKAKLYLLDEPIAGVDPAAREYILRTIVGSYNPEGTIVITTHLIADVEQVLDDFMFMGYGGVMVQGGNAEQIRQHWGKSLDQLFREVFRC